MSSSVLLRGGCVLTLGARTQNHAEADVLIEDGTVVEVGRGLRSRTAETIDASNTIIMPGFVDTHRRCWPSLFKNEGVPGRPVEPTDPTPEDIYAGTLISLLGAIEAGITTVVDWFECRGGDAHVDAAIQAHEDSGVRTILAFAPTSGADPAEQWLGLVSRRGMAPARSTTIAAGAPSIAASTPEQTASMWGRARNAGMRIHTRAGHGERGALPELAARGVLGDDVTIAHCTGLSDSDLDAIATTGTKVALTPSSDMATGHGTPSMQAFIDRGIRPGLGVDSEWAAPGDIFAQMRSAISIQHATYFELKLAGKGGLPNLLSTRDVIAYGTINGAHAAGLADATGSIEPGKRADLIVLRTDRPNVYPINDPIGAVVWAMDTSNIDWVFVGGRPLMREGVLAADTARARELAVGARQRMASSVGGASRHASGDRP